MSFLPYDSQVGMLWLEIRQGALVALSWSLPDSMAEPLEDAALCRRITHWLDDHFRRAPRGVDFPVRPAGTVFQQKVWREISRVGPGQTITYGELAKRLNSSARAVGVAAGQNPIPVVIPCHRVVGAKELGGYSGHGGLHTKRTLLSLEGALIGDIGIPFRQAC
ncbi:methylated-DNA--protein-cysteine methyltransferase [Magnetococcus marinus MC-1]|uniref:methylated-DNA--[protein]-cysteine S-methyltransferase n=1 Tax=Magnetococcus marinus (strain ATCC BAA-1437 / JCM 17883 / MC-1) TaxID=156889 RepID=A0L3W9_MAGMM|nr:methylated-DNA--[protein]-cysteine S-methyltransferase [Magnetococcus marinus]ABK42662.1 methylated-DNA--protein-cysteine methyltransferase [Magnetococcus marinus MC-1]